MDLTQRSSGYARAATAAALIAAIALFGAWLVATTARNTAADFYVYYMAGSLARHGRSFYAISQVAWDHTAIRLGVTHFTWPYRYPPYTAALVSLLVPLGAFAAMIVWVVVGALAMVAGAAFVGAALGGGRRIALAVALLALSGPAYHTIANGQVNGLAFLALAVAFWGVARGRDLPAGAGLAAAAALKLTPLALLAYFAWRRRWRALLAGVFTLALLTLVTLPITGPGVYGQYLRHAYGLTDPQHVDPSGANQTWTGVLSRLVLPTSAKVSAAGGKAAAVRLVALALSAALVVATAFVTRTRRPRTARGRSPSPGGPAPPDELLGFGMVVAATLVIGPFTWDHQFVWLLIPFVTLACRAVDDGRRPVLWALALLVAGMDLNEVVWTWLQTPAVASGLYRALSLPFFAALGVWCLSAVAVVGLTRASPSRPPAALLGPGRGEVAHR